MTNSIPSRPSSAGWSPRLSEGASSIVSSPRDARAGSASAGSAHHSTHINSRPSSAATVLSPARPVVPALALHRAFALPTARNLAPQFDAVAWDVETLDSQRSQTTWRSVDSITDAVQQVLDMNRNEEGSRIIREYPDVVHALKAVVATINQRTAQPVSGGAGFNTPLWQGKVETLDENFLERLLPLTFARALLAEEDDEEGVLKIFDCLGNAPEALNARFALMAAQHHAKSLLKSAAQDPATLGFAVEHGIETRRWLADQCPQSEILGAIKELGTKSIALAAWIPATVRAALAQAACPQPE